MGSLSVFHMIFILAIILIFFGPKRLPALGKSIGEAVRGFKKGIRGDEIDVTESSIEAQKREALNAQSEHKIKED